MNKTAYHRILIFPLVIALFILIIYQMQKNVERAALNTEYQYSVIQPNLEKEKNYDVLYYKIRLNVEVDSSLQKGLLQGAVQILFKIEEFGTDKILLNLSGILQVDSVKGASSFRHEKNHLKIHLPGKLETGKIHSVTVYYHGWPRTYHKWIYGWKLAVHSGEDGKNSPWINTINPPYGAETWFPCKDDPADKADSVRIEVEIPDTLLAVCNGVKVKEQKKPDNRKLVIWKESYPISPYLIAVNIGKFSVFRRMYYPRNGQPFPVYIYSWPEDSANIPLIYSNLFDMLNYYTRVLGAYPFEKEKYAMVIHSGSGGMENQTISSVDQFSPYKKELYAHELVHQWLGDKITNRSFHESAINEGLATFFTGLYLRASQGESAFTDFLKKNTYLKPGSIWVEKDYIPDSVYHPGRVYKKGAWFFYMLYNILGEKTFLQTIQSCLNKCEYGNVSFEDLEKEFQKFTQLNLNRFFHQWIYCSSIPHILGKVVVNQNGDRGYNYFLEIRQKQKGEAFVLPLQISFKNTHRDTLLAFEIFKKKHHFEFSLPFKAQEMVIDPQQKLLITWEVKIKSDG